MLNAEHTGRSMRPTQVREESVRNKAPRKQQTDSENTRNVAGSIIRIVDGEDLVVDTANIDEVTIERDAIDEVRDGFRDAVDLQTDLGMNIVRGNNQVTPLSFGGGLSYEGKDFEWTVDAPTIINEQSETTDTRRTTLSAGYSNHLTPRWQASRFYHVESDEQQGLEERTLLGGYIGHRLLNNRRQRFDIYAGIAVNTAQFGDLPQTEHSWDWQVPHTGCARPPKSMYS